MISYQPLWDTMKRKHITSYALIHKHSVDPHTIHKLRHNQSITMHTLESLCRILECTPDQIVEFFWENEDA